MNYCREISEGDVFRYHMLQKYGLQPKEGAVPFDNKFGTECYHAADLEPITRDCVCAGLDFSYRQHVYEKITGVLDSGFDYFSYLTDLRVAATSFTKERDIAALDIRHYMNEEDFPLLYRGLDIYYKTESGKEVSFSRATKSRNMLRTYLFGSVIIDNKKITVLDAIEQTLDCYENGPYPAQGKKAGSRAPQVKRRKAHAPRAFSFPEVISYEGTPSVYIFYNEVGKALYVGKTKHLGKRIAKHLEEQPFAEEIKDVGIMQFRSTKDMDVMEIAKIHELDPPYNKDCSPDGKISVVTVKCTTKEQIIPFWDLPCGITGASNADAPNEIRITLRGLKMNNIKALEYHLSGSADTRLELREEPGNKFDKNAIAVYVRGEFFGKVGYVGKEFTEDVRSFLKDGKVTSVRDLSVRIPEIPARGVPNALDVCIS